MEWLLFISLGVIGVESPPPVVYADQKECVQVAKKIAGENKWLYFLDMGPDTHTFEPGVFRPTVHCEPAEWSKKPRGSK